MEIEEWLIRALERLFTRINLRDAQNVSYVVFQLTEDVGFWWKSYCRTRTPTQFGAMTLNGFKEVVIQNYLPRSNREKERKFIYLKQGTMTVVEYERKFIQMSCYATHMVDSREKKAHRFEKGLRPENGCILVGQGVMTYGEVLLAHETASRLRLDNMIKKPAEPPSRKRWGNQHKLRTNKLRSKGTVGTMFIRTPLFALSVRDTTMGSVCLELEKKNKSFHKRYFLTLIKMVYTMSK